MEQMQHLLFKIMDFIIFRNMGGREKSELQALQKWNSKINYELDSE